MLSVVPARRSHFNVRWIVIEPLSEATSRGDRLFRFKPNSSSPLPLKSSAQRMIRTETGVSVCLLMRLLFYDLDFIPAQTMSFCGGVTWTIVILEEPSRLPFDCVKEPTKLVA